MARCGRIRERPLRTDSYPGEGIADEIARIAERLDEPAHESDRLLRGMNLTTGSQRTARARQIAGGPPPFQRIRSPARWAMTIGSPPGTGRSPDIYGRISSRRCNAKADETRACRLRRRQPLANLHLAREHDQPPPRDARELAGHQIDLLRRAPHEK